MFEKKPDIIGQTVSLIAQQADIPPETKAKLIEAMREISNPLQADKWIYRFVVWFMGLTVIGTILGGFIIKGVTAQDIPEGLVALGSAALGALAGLLAPSPGRKQG